MVNKAEKILFVCRHNRFRSKVAEAIFNKLNKNKDFKAESAGLFLIATKLYVEPTVMGEMTRRKYKITGTPRQLTRQIAEQFDRIIIVASDMDKEFFFDFKGKVEQWQIDDCDTSDAICIEGTIDKIEEKVKDLIDEL